MEPTVIDTPDLNSPVMLEEIFGPVLPVYSFMNIDETVKFINDRDKPLAIYYFGKCYSNPNLERLREETTSGAFCVNDAIVHIINHGFGFGGVGASGYGRYGGFDGFKQWSNPKSVMIKPTMNFLPYNTMGPPYTPAKINMLRKTFNLGGSQMRAIWYLKLVGILLLIAYVWFFQSCCVKGYIRSTCDVLISHRH